MSVCSHEMAELFYFHTIHMDTGTCIGILKYKKIFFGILKINILLSIVVFAQNFHRGLVVGYMFFSNEKKRKCTDRQEAEWGA